MAAGAIQAGRRFGFMRQGQHRALNVSDRQVRLLPVAVETPTHRQRRDLLHAIHLFDRPVATLAGDLGKHMLAVIEIHKVRKIMDLDPLDGALLLDCLQKLFDLGRLLLQHAVAVHAEALGGDSGVPAGAGRIVTVEARDLVIARVNLVRKRDGLAGRVTLVDADASKVGDLEIKYVNQSLNNPEFKAKLDKLVRDYQALFTE